MSHLVADRRASQLAPARRRGGGRFQALAEALGSHWSAGRLTIVAPDRTVHQLLGAAPGPEGRIEVRSPRFLRRLLWSAEVGFAEGFMAGEWDSPDLTALLTTLSANFDGLAGMLGGNPLMRLLRALGHARNRNSRAGSRRNIRAHYDLGDDFYGLWLDEGLDYSSALFTAPGQSLAEAQRNKHDSLARMMDLQPGHRLLEIGCGWGGFAEFAATRYGVEVTAVTISRAQHAYAARRIQAAGLADRVTVALSDYRDLAGRFDRIASIEMLEAVGEAYWPAYFSRLHALLAPGGRAGLQVITIQDQLFEAYRRQPDFIQLHVFPGGMLPSEARLRQETDRAGLGWTQIRRFGHSYADTLGEWARRYGAGAGEVRAQGFDERFDRLWRYYLAYCEAGFRTGRTDVIQLGLARG
jgi:cyclopropane-fatty-acyl-phospholipid synthase